MSVARRQRTLVRPVSVTGFGYFSGRDIRVEFWPAAENAGITFVRHDIGAAARIPASVALRINQPRRTTLELNGIRVEMVEHVLAALAGMRIDNCEVWVDAAEMPGCDGSSKAFVAAIDAAGAVEQRSPVRQIAVAHAIRVGDQNNWIEAQPYRSAGLSVSFDLDFGATSAIGHQLFALDITPDSFRRELAPCRTFIPEEAAQGILSQGVGKRVTSSDLLIFGPNGPIGNTLRFPDECVRHKVLDVVGDLALTGCEVIGHVVAHRSGHALHAELAKRLLEYAENAGQLFESTPQRRVA
ncbi:MAG TPA: UDP-3-O-acyl-N-acetylglucosamine deacetylase [Lacipirellulaceae bacterium]|jgi:UDP-3-O-acyl N-acetylglucosamine deacetylase|nr:UDP-3-O-acyl-N-acetylglucosamine deacetylase [Lacipirellulaceae bacterium]